MLQPAMSSKGRPDPAGGARPYGNEGRPKRSSKFDTQPISSSFLRRRVPSSPGMSAHDALLAVTDDPSLMPGARNALTKALGLQPGQRFVLLAQAGYEDVAAALLRAAVELGVETRSFVLDEETCERELFVQRIVGELAEADGSALVASRNGLPRAFRRAVMEIQGQRRHAHMVGVTPSMMRQSIRADHEEMHRLGERLIAHVGSCREIVVRSGVNEELVLRPDPTLRWHNGSGLLRAPGFTNLPAGEVFATPASVEGTLVPDGGVWLPKGPALGRSSRITMRFEGGRLVGADGPESDDIMAAVGQEPDGARVGQMCFGTNVGVLTPIGAMLQDSKIPGFHLILGYTCPELTGATWNSGILVPMLVRRADVTVDGKPLLVRGRYARELLG